MNKEFEKQYPIGGFAPGSYMCTCRDCKTKFIGDKRAWQCEPCAIKEKEEVKARLMQQCISDVFEVGKESGISTFQTSLIEKMEIQRIILEKAHLEAKVKFDLSAEINLFTQLENWKQAIELIKNHR